MLRTVLVWIVGGFATMALSSLVLIGALFRADEKLYEWIARSWGRVVLWLSGVSVEVQGRENLMLDRPQIVASNHQSWFDVFTIAANLPKKFRFVAKEELGRIPVFGQAWNTAGHISVNRSDRVQAIRTLEHYGDLIRKDNSTIVIFPEGTRSRDGHLLPFKKGAFMLALHTHVDIVPTAVTGSRFVLKKGDWRIRKGRIILRFGQPIPTVGYTESNREELIGLVRSQIEKMVEEAK
jgi:1-acyl-sn-glycerol-3-phosphate acyltransferase